jgi:dTMP kinase
MPLAGANISSKRFLPALKAGKMVICDRYLDSSLAYQGGARGLGIDNVLAMNLFATEGLEPDLTLLFDIKPEIGLRKNRRQFRPREVNRLDVEKLSFHNQVRGLSRTRQTLSETLFHH